MSGWDDDFNRTYAEYNGESLKPRICDYCSKYLITGEDLFHHKDYGNLCPDCIDYVENDI